MTAKHDCPACKKQVDPLRSAAVSIVDGQLVHFCSAACREEFVQRDHGGREGERSPESDATPNDSDARQIPDVSVPDEEAARDELVAPATSEESNDSKLSSKSKVASVGSGADPSIVLSRRLWLGELALLIVLVGVASVLGGDIWSVVLAGAGIVLGAVLEVIRIRRLGIARILSELTGIAAISSVLTAGILEGQPVWLETVWAVFAVLLFRSVGRLVSLQIRLMSGLVSTASTRGDSFWNNWLDNSAFALRLRKVALLLEWLRLPIAVISWGWMVMIDVSVPSALYGAAMLVFVLEPSLLRKITSDAYFRVAVLARGNRITVRDADSVAGLGGARLILMQSRHTLLSETVKIVDWQVHDSGRESQIMSALDAVESGFGDRYALAICSFLRGKKVSVLETVDARRYEGAGVYGETMFGAVVCGTREAMLKADISTGLHEEWAARIEDSGRRAFFVAMDGEVAAMFAAEEAIHGTASKSVHRLSRSGLEPVFYTSAETAAANGLAARIGVDYIKSGRTDHHLEETLKEMHSSGERVAIVGAGEGFEASIRDADASVHTGAERGATTMAGVQGGGASFDKVVDVILWSRDARRSVVRNLVAVLFFVFGGGCLAIGWTTWPMVVFLCGASTLISLLCSVNAPFPGIEYGRVMAKRIWARVLRRTAAG